VQWAAAAIAQAELRLRLGIVYVTLGITAGARLREERFVIRGSAASVSVQPWFVQTTTGIGIGSR
jgi:hypothetical protein